MVKRIFFGIITMAGIAHLFWVGYIFSESRDALKWPQTRGQVISSMLFINHLPKFIDFNSDPIRWYGADVRYTYSVGGRTYLSNRVSFQDGGTRSPDRALKEMNKYRRQHTVIVYYNPVLPQQAVLEPSYIGEIFLPLVLGGFLVLVGLYFLFSQPLDFKVSLRDTHLHWGNAYQKQGKFLEALNEYNIVIEISPQLAIGYVCRGIIYLQQENWNPAIADFEKAHTLGRKDAILYFNRARAYLGKKQYGKAWEDIQKVMKMGYEVKPDILEKIKKGL